MSQPNTLGSDPAEDAGAVTPSDVTNLTRTARALYVGGAGNVVVVTPSATVVTFTNVQAGSILPVRIRRVNSTNTTATNIVALY